MGFRLSAFMTAPLIQAARRIHLAALALSLVAGLGTVIPLGAQPASETGAVAGTVRDGWEGGPLGGVTVTVRGTTLAVMTGPDGRYRIEAVPVGLYIVVFAKPGWARTTITDVRVAPGQTSTVDLNLKPEFYELEEYEVVAEDLEEQETVLLLDRQRATAFLESIGEQSFSRLAASDAAEIMTKITAVSVVEGKFAVIRGLSDRYNTALLNGADVPSADPYRKAVQLDLFPAEVIQSVVVSKTFTPDLPGGFSGGAMNIVTRSFPERFVFKVGAGLGFNTQSTFNDNFLTYPGGGLDAFAIDDGTRGLPSELEAVTSTGLERLLRTATSGSLSIPLEEKTAAAAQMDAYVRSFGSPIMGPERGAPPLDHDFNLLIGDTVQVARRPLGFYAGLSYERDYRFYEDGVRGRYAPVAVGQLPEPYALFEDARSLTSAQWSSLVSLAYQLFDDHELAFTFLHTQNSEDEARQQTGQISSSGENQFQDERRTHMNTLHWTERGLTAFQPRGTHEFPQLRDLHLDWLVSLANTTQDEPDLRYFNTISAPNPADPSSPERVLDIGNSNTPFPDRPARYFRALEDENLNAKLDLTLPGEDWRGFEWKVKAGFLASGSERTFEERTFTVDGGNGTVADPQTFPHDYMLAPYYQPPELVIQNNRPRYVFSRSLSSFYGNSFYNGQQDIYAVYAMAELPLLESIRLVGGVRYETTYLEVNSSGFQSAQEFSGLIDQGDLLPAVSLVWNPVTNMNLRASYSQTLARPTYREFARYRGFDPAGDQIVEGNPSLEMSDIQNLDLRWEWFTSGGGLLSAGAFLKLLVNPIEKFNAGLDPEGNPVWTSSSDFVTFLNTDDATVWGFEIEARHNLAFLDPLLEPFSLGMNFAWLESQVDLQPEIQQLKYITTGERATSRPLYDQSPYILNANVSYENPRSDTSVSLVGYYAAERLALIVNNGWDVYEQAAPQLDLVIAQGLGRGFTLKFSAKNLLNPEIVRSYGVSGPTDETYLYSSYRKGITFGLALAYTY